MYNNFDVNQLPVKFRNCVLRGCDAILLTGSRLEWTPTKYSKLLCLFPLQKVSPGSQSAIMRYNHGVKKVKNIQRKKERKKDIYLTESRGSSWALGRREWAETIKGSGPDPGLSSCIVTYLRDSSWCQLLFGKTWCFDLIYRVRWRTKTWSDCRGTWAKKTWFKSHLCNCVPVQQLFQTTRGLHCKKKKRRPIFVATLRSTGCSIPFFVCAVPNMDQKQRGHFKTMVTCEAWVSLAGCLQETHERCARLSTSCCAVLWHLFAHVFCQQTTTCFVS